jgi:transposase
MTVFPTAAHLVSWAKFSPIDATSAGRHKGNSTGKGNPRLVGTLGEVVAGTSRTNTFLGERYRRLARRRRKKRAIVALGNSVLTIVWHLGSNPQATTSSGVSAGRTIALSRGPAAFGRSSVRGVTHTP